MQCYGINHTMYLMICGQYLSFLYLSHLFADLGAVRDVEIHCIDGHRSFGFSSWLLCKT